MSTTSTPRTDAARVAALGSDERRRAGIYLTPRPIARLMAWLLKRALPAGGQVIDPAAGTGRLLVALAEQSGDSSTPRLGLHGVERSAQLAELCNRQLRPAGGGEAVCRTGDALTLLRPEARREFLGRDTFDGVIANPPYVREKEHGTIFRRVLAEEPGWRDHFSPRQDLQQLFLALGLEMLAPGGSLVYLMNPYWLHSDAAEGLRRRLTNRFHVAILVDFGDVQLFSDAPGQHSVLIQVVDRASGRLDATQFLRVVDAPRRGLDELARDIRTTLEGTAAPPYLDPTRGAGPVTSGPRHRWYHPHRDDPLLAKLERTGVCLGECFDTHQGVVSGADRVSRRNQERVDGAPLGTGIFVLTRQEVNELGLLLHELALLMPLYRARDIQPARVARRDSTIIYLDHTARLEGCPTLERHLSRFRRLLSGRRECRQGKIPWYALHWPREARLFERPRVVTPRRATEPRFAMGPLGHCEQSDIALITDRNDDVDRLRALMVVLNSEPVAVWCRHRGKHKGRVREFFGRPLEEIPLPRTVVDDPAAFRALGRFAEPERLGMGSAAVSTLYGV